MKKNLLILFMLLTAIAARAQDSSAIAKDTTYWVFFGKGTMTFSQVTLKNWAAGGRNNISLNSFFNFNANYKKGNHSWENRLDLGYGFIRQGDVKENTFIKSDDKIDFLSKYGRRLSKDDKWYLTAQTNFKTQFAPGFKKPGDSIFISDFMAPAYLITSLGLNYQIRPFLSAFLSPITNKITIVNSTFLADQGAFGVEAAEYDSSGTRTKAGKKVRYEAGAYFSADFKKEIFTNVAFESRVNLFSNYLEDPQNIDVSWENVLVMKVNKYITANFLNQIIYDHDIDVPITEEVNGEEITIGTGPRIQYKQVFGVGLTYTY